VGPTTDTGTRACAVHLRVHTISVPSTSVVWLSPPVAFLRPRAFAEAGGARHPTAAQGRAAGAAGIRVPFFSLCSPLPALRFAFCPFVRSCCFVLSVLQALNQTEARQGKQGQQSRAEPAEGREGREGPTNHSAATAVSHEEVW
jgi:hypothetical protein